MDEGLLALPFCVFSTNVISSYLSPQDRKALRGACKVVRRAVNAEVRVARVSGGHICSNPSRPLTLRRVAAAFPFAKALVLSDTVNDRVCGPLLATFLAESAECNYRGQIVKGATFQSLDVKHTLFMTAYDLQQLLLACPQLRSLAAPRWADESHLRAIAPFSHLAELDLGDGSCDVISITDKSLAYMPKLPALRALSLRRCVNVTDSGIAHLGSTTLPNMTHINLSATRVTGTSGFSALTSNIRSIALQNCRTFGEAGLAAVCAVHAGGLRSLQLCGTAVQPYGSSLRHLAPATGLERLDLGQSWEVDGAGLAALACCPTLSELRLGNFNLRRPCHRDHGLPSATAAAAAVWPPPLTSLPPSPATTFASIAASGGGGSGAARALPSLTRLSLGGMFGQAGLQRLLPGLRRLVRLELSGLGAARDDVLALLLRGGGAPALRELKLASGGPDLTPAGLLSLAALPALERLALIACPGATEDAVQQLVSAVRAAGRRLTVDVSAVKAAAAASAGGGDVAASGAGPLWPWSGCAGVSGGGAAATVWQMPMASPAVAAAVASRA